MGKNEYGSTRGSESEDVRVEALEELLAGLRRFPDELRLVRDLIAKQLAPELDPSVRAPVRPARKPA